MYSEWTPMYVCVWMCVNVCVTEMIAQTIHKKQIENIEMIEKAQRKFFHPSVPLSIRFWQMALVCSSFYCRVRLSKVADLRRFSFLYIETLYVVVVKRKECEKQFFFRSICEDFETALRFDRFLK